MAGRGVIVVVVVVIVVVIVVGGGFGLIMLEKMFQMVEKKLAMNPKKLEIGSLALAVVVVERVVEIASSIIITSGLNEGTGVVGEFVEAGLDGAVAISVGGILESAGVVGTFVEACEDGEEGPVAITGSGGDVGAAVAIKVGILKKAGVDAIGLVESTGVVEAGTVLIFVSLGLLLSTGVKVEEAINVSRMVLISVFGYELGFEKLAVETVVAFKKNKGSNAFDSPKIKLAKTRSFSINIRCCFLILYFMLIGNEFKKGFKNILILLY